MSVTAEETRTSALVNRVGVESHIAPLDSLNSPEAIADLRAAVSTCLESRENRIVLDFSAVKLISSAGLEAVLECHQQVARQGGWMKISKCKPLVQNVFRITGLSQQLSVSLDDSDETDRDNVIGHDENNMLGELLIRQQLIDRAKLEQALHLQSTSGKRLGEIVVAEGWVQERDVLRTLGQQLSVPFVRLVPGLSDPETAGLLDRKTMARLKVLPLFKVHGLVWVATANPQDLPTLGEIQDRVGCEVRPVLARVEEILENIDEGLGSDDLSIEMLTDELEEDFELVENFTPDDYDTIDEIAAGSPIVNLVNGLIQRAVRDGASDIHIEPGRKKSRIRLRVDGVLYEIMAPRIELHPAIVSRLKVMANLDISERRLPQDGRIQVLTGRRPVDLRFSSLPGLYGEKVVLRVLDKNQAILDVNKLGMSEGNLNGYKGLLNHGYGLILVTGPTGSGKTTSLYAALNLLNSLEKNIVTIEDPVEYQVDIINQNEVRDKIGLTFAKVLKHVLRQDPDIVMVGEIRESETASIAVQAALTGHLVLSTLHTNDSAGAITRMIDMGVEPYLLSSALIGVVAQRLVRTVCPSCKTLSIAPPEVAKQYGWQDEQVQLARGRGCPECFDSGYKGRIGIHELLETDTELQRLIVSNPSRDQLTEFMSQHNNRTLFQDGLDRAREGKTTIEEVARVVNI